jgi:hypothetical protein
MPLAMAVLASNPCPWCFVPGMDDPDAIALLTAASYVRLGDGTRVLFWTDKWLLGGRSVAEVYPTLASFARKSSVTVAQALKRNRWIRDIRGGISTAAMG